MKTILTGALTALTLAGALTATALPAAAEDHHVARIEHRGWGRTDAALLGLSVGAALAGGVYAPGYYAPGYVYDGPRCRLEARWNPYWGGYQRVRVCY